jgi:S-adenosylmethionine synthetase
MPGHPDKLADQISDAILDAYLTVDSNARVAIEVMVRPAGVEVAGEVRTNQDLASNHLETVVRGVIRDVGYTAGVFNCDNAAVAINIGRQSGELSSIVEDESRVVRKAGDQSVVYGYAINENDSYLPAATFYANLLMQSIYLDCREGALPKLGPDGKVLVDVEYKNGRPVGIKTLALSLQHGEDTRGLEDLMFDYVAGLVPLHSRDRFIFNASGSFRIGGPEADTGLTGRKIVVDSYGPGIAVGGGAFSGKDGSKVDRSGAYMARYIAKNVVAAGLAEQCLVRLAYCIGLAQPISFDLCTFGTYRVDEVKIKQAVLANVDLSPGGLFDTLALGRPMYRGTANFGHFGRHGFAWEELDLVDTLVEALGVTS